MLKTGTGFKNVVLVGSSSQIGRALVEKLLIQDKAIVHLVGRSFSKLKDLPSQKVEQNFYKCDFSKTEEVDRFVGDLSKFKYVDLVIIALGILPDENSEFDLTSLNNTFQINTLSSVLILSSFAQHLNQYNGGSIVVCSSVASIRPRLRNFSYGASKSALDFYARGLQNKLGKTKVKITILRPGFIFTKMTKSFKPAPFAINLDRFTNSVVTRIIKGRKVVYTPRILVLVMNVAKILPRWIFDKLG